MSYVKKSTGRKGFTLVELLIVIVVIGILSAMMMLSSTEAVSSAKANNIISNLRNLKTAVLSWYADNLSRVVIDGKDGTYNKYRIDTDGTKDNLKDFLPKGGSAEIAKYLSNGDAISIKNKNSTLSAGDYVLIDIHYKYWYICYNVGSDANIKSKLAAKANSVGLVGKGGVNNDDINDPYTNQTYACMLVLSLEQ